MFIDTHAHLTDDAFKNDVNEVLKKCKDKMVEKIITSGFDLASSKEAISFCEKHENVFASVGIYPENIYDFDSDVENKLFELARNEKVVAIGEIGLQYTDNMPDKEKQKDAFLRQIKMAYTLKKPIVIHCRDAYGDTIEILEKNKQFLSYGGTMHCFGGSVEIAQRLVSWGLYISVGGVSTFKNAERLRGVLSEVPLEKILLETDCPYLTPAPFRGQRNDPSFIPIIAENLAKLKGATVEEVANITSQNARRLFNI